MGIEETSEQFLDQNNLTLKQSPSLQETGGNPEQASIKTSSTETLRAFNLPETKIDPFGELESIICASEEISGLTAKVMEEMELIHQRAEVEFIEEIVVKGKQVYWITSDILHRKHLIDFEAEKVRNAKAQTIEKLSHCNDDRMRSYILHDLEVANNTCRQELARVKQELLDSVKQLSEAVKEYQSQRVENDQWENFVKEDLFLALGISEVDKAQWLEAQQDSLKEVGKRSFDNIRLITTLFTARLHKEKGFDQQQIKELITKEVTRIKDQVFISFNMSAESALRFFQRGKQLPITVLPENLQEQRGAHHNLNDDFEGYLIRRKIVESRLRFGDLPAGCVSAALASPNGSSEKRGGASVFGDVFLVLDKDKIAQRTTFTLGDSMNSNIMQEVLGTKLIRHAEKHMQDRQLIFPHAVIAESVLNILKPMISRGAGYAYVEALIYGGFARDEVKEMKVPSREELYMRGDTSINPRVVGKLKEAFIG